jgi:hypothetical protein
MCLFLWKSVDCCEDVIATKWKMFVVARMLWMPSWHREDGWKNLQLMLAAVLPPVAFLHLVLQVRYLTSFKNKLTCTVWNVPLKFLRSHLQIYGLIPVSSYRFTYLIQPIIYWLFWVVFLALVTTPVLCTLWRIVGVSTFELWEYSL